MRLFIAEKPSVAKALAEQLGATATGDGYLTCGEDTLTWCFGHMLEQAEPDAYTSDDIPKTTKGKKIWRMEDLPIIPQSWQILPKEDAKKQLNTIGRLLEKAHVIVHAGDADREGQLLVDEVLEYFENKKPVLRFWVAAHDAVSLQRGLDALKDNDSYRGLGEAAKARARADWLIGMNLSRAYTLCAKQNGNATLLAVGRVQTPTLALVVERDRCIANFKPEPYFTLKADIQHANGTCHAQWQAQETQQGLDTEGRLVDAIIADNLVKTLKSQQGIVKKYSQKPKIKYHPKAYSLSDITLHASNRYGYSATEVLDACQALYEKHKLTSYPRTDCAFLPESQHADAAHVLDAMRHVNPQLTPWIDKADVSIKSKTWDDKKVTVHFGIIPTMHKGGIHALNEKERHIYDLIARAYIAQFYPLHEYLSTDIDFEIGGECFAVHGKTVTVNGWCDVVEEWEKSETPAEEQCLPVMQEQDGVLCVQVTRQDAKTRAPARFTEGTLQRAMENIHQYIDAPEHKKLLRDGDGIGTSATRANIIAELKRKEYLALQGKYIVSTALGQNLIRALPEVVKSPVMTAIYERFFSEIDKKPELIDPFVQRQAQFVSEQVQKVQSMAVNSSQPQYTCSTCQKSLGKRKGKNGYFWSCTGYPECKATYPDSKGKPNFIVKTGAKK